MWVVSRPAHPYIWITKAGLKGSKGSITHEGLINWGRIVDGLE